MKVSTYRNLFKNQVPIGHDLFSRLLKIFNASGSHTMNRTPRIVRLHEIQITNSGYAEILFQMVDPNIPDNVLSDRTNGDLRVARRKATEDPAVSAHMVVNLDSKYDQKRSYPTCIENIDFLPRSLIVIYFNEWMANSLSEKIVRKGEKEAKTFRPRFEFIAPASQTISGALESGGVLKGVKWVEDKLTQTTFGDSAFPVEKRTDVSLTVKNRPTKDTAKKILSDIYNSARGRNPTAIKVTIEDSNSLIKTVGIDPQQNNVLSNIFLPQAHFDNFSKPLAMCEGSLRLDLISKMKAALKS